MPVATIKAQSADRLANHASVNRSARVVVWTGADPCEFNMTPQILFRTASRTPNPRIDCIRMISGRNKDSEFYSYSESNCGALNPNTARSLGAIGGVTRSVPKI